METGSAPKRIAKNSLMLYGRLILTMGISLYASRLVLRGLGVEDYGIYNLVGGVVSFFVIINAGMLASTQRFLNYGVGENDIERLRKVFHASMIIHAVIALVVIILVEITGLWLLYNKLMIPTEKLTSAFWVFQASTLCLVINIITVPYNAVVISHEKMSQFAYISVINSFLNLGIALLISIYGGNRLVLYAFLMVLLSLSSFLMYFIYTWKNFEEVHGRIYTEKEIINDMTKFAGWSMVGCLSGILNNQGMSVLLGMFFFPAVNAARGLAVQIQSGLDTVWGTVQSAVNPQLMQSYAQKDYGYFMNLLYKSSKYYALMLLFVAIPVFIRIDDILQLWLGEQPDYTASFTRYLIGLSFINAVSTPLMRASDATGDIKKYHLVVGGTQMLTLPIAYVFLRLGGSPNSVFMVALCVWCCALCARLIVLKEKISLQIRSFVSEVLMRIAFVILISFPLCYVISTCLADGLWGLMLFCLCTTVINALAIYTVGINNTEREFVLRKIKERFRLCK